MVNGKTLIVTDVDVHKLTNDVLLSVIGSKGQLLTNNKMALKYIVSKYIKLNCVFKSFID